MPSTLKFVDIFIKLSKSIWNIQPNVVQLYLVTTGKKDFFFFIKNFSEDDPSVHDSSAEALGAILKAQKAGKAIFLPQVRQVQYPCL